MEINQSAGDYIISDMDHSIQVFKYRSIRTPYIAVNYYFIKTFTTGHLLGLLH